MYECRDWSAWYNRMPVTDEPNVLHVTGTCSLPSGSISITLEPDNEGIIDDPEFYVLRLRVEVPPGGTTDYVERDVHWEGDVGPDIRRVTIRIPDSPDVTIEVTIAQMRDDN